MLWKNLVILAIAGAIGSALANRGVAIFHDGLRPIMPELMEGRLQRREFTSIAFGFSFGLVFGFGVPFSMTSALLMNHALWLGTDIIGTWFRNSFNVPENNRAHSNLGLICATLSGALYGCLLVIGLEGFVNLWKQLPISIFDHTGQLNNLIVITFAVFPIIAIAYQFGARHGLVSFLIAMLVRQISLEFNFAQPNFWAFMVGMLLLISLAIREEPSRKVDQNYLALFAEKAKRVRNSLPVLALLGGIYGLGTNLSIIMEGPQSLSALAQNDKTAAIFITFARALSFTPLKVMSILTTGVFATDGFGFVATAGLISPKPIIAFISGAIVMSIEVVSLLLFAALFNRFPGVLKAADNARTAMTKLLEVGSLVGGMIAASNLAPGFGLITMAGIYLLNESAGTPIVRAAIGPIGVIVIGSIANLISNTTV